jgi:uncharacterized membrane protein YcaP (DUF421 family)
LEDAAKDIFGAGEELTPLQTSARAVVMAVICLILIRLAGRRSFGMGTPVDNVLAILIGAILSRGVTGASPFWSVVAGSATIVALHRVLALIGAYSHWFGKLVKGEARVVFEKGEFVKHNMRYCQVSERDVMSGIRESLHEDSLENVERIFIERNGRFSVIMKKNAKRSD